MSTAIRSEEAFTLGVARELTSLPESGSWSTDRILARHCLLDWLGCTVAGAAEPVTRAVRGTVETLHDRSDARGASLIGTDVRSGPQEAALVNGTAAHALDFDDGHAWMNAHPSAPIVSAGVALGEAREVDGAALLTAVIRGFHAGTVLGLAMGVDHYLAGWHTTGTIGAFGAAAASASILGLDDTGTALALAIASARAGGIKGVFGSMGKPLNAGTAAAGGVLAALLAQQGFEVPLDVVERNQGQSWVQGARWDTSRITKTMSGASAISAVSFKEHACCGATHATIDGLRELTATGRLVPERVRRVDVHVSKQVTDMCIHDRPETGLEAKFSLTHAAALVLARRATTDVSFSDTVVRTPGLQELRERVQVYGDRGDRGMGTTLVVHLDDGRTLTKEIDRSHTPGADLDEQWERLSSKFLALTTPVLGSERSEDLVGAIARLDSAVPVRDGLGAARLPLLGATEAL